MTDFVNWCSHFARFCLELTSSKLFRRLVLLYGQVCVRLPGMGVKNLVVSYPTIKKKNNKR